MAYVTESSMKALAFGDSKSPEVVTFSFKYGSSEVSGTLLPSLDADDTSPPSLLSFDCGDRFKTFFSLL